MPAYLLALLGVVIPSHSRATIVGVDGGSVTADFALVDLELRRGKASYRWAARVGFDPGSKVILGHTGVIEHFLASFNHRQRYVTLQPNGMLPTPGQNLV